MERAGYHCRLDHQASAPLLGAVALPELEPRLQRVGRDGSTQRHVLLHCSRDLDSCRRRVAESQQSGSALERRLLSTKTSLASVDRVTTLRCLYQLSCIPDEDRDPERLVITNPDGSRTVNLVAFEDFCRANPQLVRRLKEAAHYDRRFEGKVRIRLRKFTRRGCRLFRANRKLPSRYKPGSRDLNEDGSSSFRFFPICKPTSLRNCDVRTSRGSPEDAFLAARAWYMLANTRCRRRTRNRTAMDRTTRTR